MRKVYLLITSALMLLSSSTLWAANIAKIGSTTYTDAQAEALWAACSSTPGNYTVVEIYNVTFDFIIPAGKYVELRPAREKKGRVYVYNHSNGNITNNGNLKILFGTWSGGTFLNNGSMIIGSTGTGTTAFAPSYLGDAEYTLATDSYEYTNVNPSSTYNGYKYVRASADIVATVNGQPYTASTFNVAMENSSSSYPVVMQKNFTVSSLTVNWGALSYDVYIELNGKNITINGGKQQGVTIKNSKLHISNNGEYDDAHGILTSNASVATLLVVGTDNIEHSGIYSGVYVGPKVTVKNTDLGCGIAVEGPSGSSTIANGAYVEIAGTVVATQGSNNYTLYLNGNIQNTLYYPSFNILDGAIIGNDCNLSACIYAAGYGLWNIGAATLKANTPIYAKAGVININGADIEACGAFSEPVEYGNGFYPTGDAIIMDTHKSYAGNMLLNIMGDDTQIKSAHGYAIHEAMTKAPASDASSAIGLTIQGTALLQGGDVEDPNNATKFTERFTQALIDGSDSQYHWVLNGVSGGRYTSEPSVVAPGYKAELNTTTGYWEVKPQSTPAPEKLFTIKVNTEWPATELTDNSEVLIKTNATLTVPSISVEDGSVITVEPGAKLVAGANGITTASTSGLVLKADKAHGTGMVLFDGTTSNKQPQGTVELYLVAKKIDDSNYVWQHFGIPTTSAPTITRIEPVSYKDWDVKQGWIYTSGSAALTAPWVGHNVTTSATTEGNIISFAGTLVGMTDVTLNLSQTGYNCLSNSFTAPISVKSFVNSIDPTLTTDGMVWIYDPETDNFTKKNKASFILNPTDVFMPSMQGFFLLNNGSSPIEVSLPYSNVETTAGLRHAPAYNGGIISLSNGVATSTLQILEGDEFSDEFESTFDGYQMPTDNIQIYAIQGTDKLVSIATNNIDGKEIEIVTKAGTEYTLSFSNLMGNAFKMQDLLTGEDVEVSEDNVYRFTAEPNSTLRRFKIGKGEVSADEANADAVQIWANNDVIFVANNAAEADIEIINLSGVVVTTAAANSEAVQAIPVAGLASGVYVVRVGTATAKVVK